jgi:hypothetical protein
MGSEPDSPHWWTRIIVGGVLALLVFVALTMIPSEPLSLAVRLLAAGATWLAVLLIGRHAWDVFDLLIWWV